MASGSEREKEKAATQKATIILKDKENTPFWVSWYTGKELGPWTIGFPWWVSGEDLYGNVTVCSAIMAKDKEGAEQFVYDAYDKRPESILFRFVDPKPSNWSPFSSRFVRKPWMVWFGDLVDDVYDLPYIEYGQVAENDCSDIPAEYFRHFSTFKKTGEIVLMTLHDRQFVVLEECSWKDEKRKELVGYGIIFYGRYVSDGEVHVNAREFEGDTDDMRTALDLIDEWSDWMDKRGR